MNSIPKYVVSTTLKSAEWNNSTMIKQNVVEEIANLKQQSGQDILVFGSGLLTQSLMAHGLVDQYTLLVYSIVVGSGKRLFTEGSLATLELIETRMISSGLVALTYHTNRK